MNLLLLFTVTAYLACAISATTFTTEQTGPVCYSCTGVYDLIDCHAVERCGYGQVCFIEKDPSNYGKRNLGCRDAGICQNVTTDTTCTSCCRGDLCNKKGCEIREIPHPRGPACYKCTNEESPLSCTQIKHCSVGEVCILSRIRDGNNVTFDTNCLNKYFCPSTETIALGKRDIRNRRDFLSKRSGSTTECLRCCSTDLCNDMECPSVYNTQTPPPTPTTTSTTQTSTTTLPFPKQVDGKFGEWSSWTRCPYSCGRDGIQHRFRPCNNPPPQNGGLPCNGSHIDTKLCRNAPCCNGPPVITFIENDVTAKAGDFVKLRCNATHADSLHWEGPKIIGQKFPENVRVIYGLNLLVVSNIAHSNTGTYICVAANLCGITAKYVNIDLFN